MYLSQINEYKGKQQFAKAEILEKYPDISLGTIERVMAKMKDEGLIIALGTGRSAKWKRI